MFIEHREYLALLDEIDYLKKDNALLRQENQILTQQLFKEKQQRFKLEDHHQKNIKLIEELHEKTILHQSGNTKEIIQKINQSNITTKSFLENRFQALENAAITESKQAQLKQVKSKLDVYEMTEFVNKVKAIYREAQSSDVTSSKKQTLGDIKKWIKSLASMASSQQKHHLSETMSTSNLKKQGKKCSKMKENKQVLNVIENRSKISVGELQSPKNII